MVTAATNKVVHTNHNCECPRQIVSRALSLELIHGREKGRNLFANMGVQKRMHHNRRCEVLLKDDLRRLAPESPAGTGAGLGPGIRDRDIRLNYTPG